MGRCSVCTSFLALTLVSPRMPTHMFWGRPSRHKDGRFRFGKVPSGMYVVFVRGGSIDIALVKPKKSESDIVAIENFADSCVSVTVLSEDAKERTYGSTSPCY